MGVGPLPIHVASKHNRFSSFWAPLSGKRNKPCFEVRKASKRRSAKWGGVTTVKSDSNAHDIDIAARRRDLCSKGRLSTSVGACTLGIRWCFFRSWNRALQPPHSVCSPEARWNRGEDFGNRQVTSPRQGRSALDCDLPAGEYGHFSKRDEPADDVYNCHRIQLS
jgi:hypothetical protein